MKKQRPSFVQFASPWFLNPGTVRLPFPPDGLSAEEIAQRLVDGRLTQPYIVETTSERSLYFGRYNVQSVVRLSDADALVAAYTRKMMAFLLFNPNPKRITMIGLGGGSLAKFCYRHLREAVITVVEIDAGVIALRDEFCIPADNERFRIVCDDAAHYIGQPSDQIDVLLIDAFDPAGVAPTLASSDFYEQAAHRLSPNGVLVMNFSGDTTRYDAHMQRIRTAFGGNALLVPMFADDNLLLFAFQGRIPQLTTDGYASHARYLQSRLALEFPRYLRRICRAHVLA